MKTFLIKVQGIVQGVGFRPFIKNLADRLGIHGYVINTSNGVEIKITESERSVIEFIKQINLLAPPISHIVSADFFETNYEVFKNFEIRPSEKFKGKLTFVAPDAGICEDCGNEILSPKEKRFGYPFANCTNCGPRYSIIETIPYDRPNTSMKPFPLCSFCLMEYNDSMDRRFHAQPIACGDCGPSLKLNYKGEIINDCDLAIGKTAENINQGEIVALKGLGGYHLICDPFNDEALSKLRLIKRRKTKPFALMVKNIDVAEKYVKMTPAQKDLFLSPASPIVLVDWVNPPFSRLVSPSTKKIGIMRAYTPLHLLLMDRVGKDFILATSGNMRDEPISAGEAEAENNLKSFTDIFLHHNRGIINRVDDSVAACLDDGYTLLRRSRGFAPFPVMIKGGDDVAGLELFAAGANLKSSMAFYKDGYAFLSQYIGDLDNIETENFYGEVFSRMKTLFGINAEKAVRDLHPSYRSSVFADNLGVETFEVQHHVAHFASCLCENGVYGDALGVVMDGFGLGADKKSGWGGEFFVKQGCDILRVAHLSPILQPGHDGAAKYPCRMAASYLYSAGLLEKYEPYLKNFLQMTSNELALIKYACDNKVNSIYTTSAGRLFEAAGSLVLKKRENEYEGESAIMFETLIRDDNKVEGYPFKWRDNAMLTGDVFGLLLNDLEQGVSGDIISAKFHNGFASIVAEKCWEIAQEYCLDTVALTGGVFQNIYLLQKLQRLLLAKGLRVLTHRKVPSNDQGIALGQLYACLLNLAIKQ